MHTRRCRRRWSTGSPTVRCCCREAAVTGVRGQHRKRSWGTRATRGPVAGTQPMIVDDPASTSCTAHHKRFGPSIVAADRRDLTLSRSARQPPFQGARCLQRIDMGAWMDTAKVLVVEDVPELSRLLEMTFELDGRFVPVGTATSVGAALDLAAREKPDAVVLDLSIDGIDGMGVLPSLRACLPNARIIVFTGRDDPGLRESALAAGASAWVLKGGDLSSLLDELSGAIPTQPPGQ